MIVKLLVLILTFLGGLVLAWPVIRFTESPRRGDW